MTSCDSQGHDIGGKKKLVTDKSSQGFVKVDMELTLFTRIGDLFI